MAKKAQEVLVLIGVNTAYIRSNNFLVKRLNEQHIELLHDELLDVKIFYILTNANALMMNWHRH